MCLLVASLLIGYFCITESYLAAPLLPAKTSAFRWRADVNSDAWIGGKSVMHIKEARERLRFDFELVPGAEHPFASAELAMIGKNGKPVLVDLSRYATVSFFVKCAPSNTLQVNIPTFDPKISRRDNVLTYRMPTGYFSCGPSETRVELDLKHLEIPQWWFDMFKLDLSQHAYRLDQVPKIAIGSTHQSPHSTLAGVDIRDVVLEGRDRDYLVALGVVLAALWLGFGVWFFRAHARALIADMNAKLKKDLPLVAYQQLSMEPHRDKEKAAILRFIATNYTDAHLDLERIVAETGANRNKINDILKAELGFTFSGYLNKLRLTEAARLLAEKGTATVAEIAYSVGYSNVSYFNKLFKEEYGCTPKAFRLLTLPPEKLQQSAH
jgi:AraC-like DNA-binding protein